MPKQKKTVQESTEWFKQIMKGARTILGEIAEKRRSEAKSRPDNLGSFITGPMKQPSEEMLS